jgi:hypothetical protein
MAGFLHERYKYGHERALLFNLFRKDSPFGNRLVLVLLFGAL